MSFPSISIVVPARDEEKSIEPIIARMPKFPGKTEIIFVEGHSTDRTLDEIKRVSAKYASVFDISYAVQDGIGKANAVWKGFSLAKNDIIVILDGDMTVLPEELIKFYETAAKNPNSFINGTRLVYKMERGAMRFINYLGNKFFAIFLSLIIRQKITDTLCGTKGIYYKHFQKINYSGLLQKIDDPFCDFTLLLAADRLGLKIIEVPVNYRKRIYGGTKIRRFKDGWKLLKIALRAKKVFSKLT